MWQKRAPMLSTVKLITSEQLVLFREKINKCATRKTQNGFHHTNGCMSHLLQDFNASSMPRGSVCITRWEVAWRAGKFFMFSSKFWTNHREADFYLHTFPRSNCVMRPFSKWCPGRVQSESCSKEIWFNFHSVKSKCDHAKVILVSTTPFEMLKKASFWIPKDTFQSIKKDFTLLVLWQPPISSFRW